MARGQLTVRMARWSATHPWRAIAMWVAVVVACFALGSMTGTKESTNEGDIGEVTRAMARILAAAFPDDVDADLEARAAKALGHVWWSATISWANGMGDGDWVVDELRQAGELIADRFA